MAEDKILENKEIDENIVDDGSVTLEDFLLENTVEDQETEVVISERLSKFKFRIGTMTKEELEKYQKLCIVRDKRGKVLQQNTMRFNEMIVENHCIYPNFKSQEFLNKLQVNTPSQAFKKVLKVGELSKLAEEIMKFNGFDEDFEDIRKEAKN